MGFTVVNSVSELCPSRVRKKIRIKFKIDDPQSYYLVC